MTRIWIFLLGLSFQCFALETVEVIGLGKHKRSIALGRGAHDGVSIGDRAELLVGKAVHGRARFMVARAKAVKVFGTTSIWWLSDISHPKFLKKGLFV